MLNIALTGNIAAGKSAVLDLFRVWGATVIDADQLVRNAQRPGTEVLQAIAFRFGREVILPGGELDRAALRGKVMGDEAALAALNAIVHPAVRRERARLQAEAAARGDLIIVNDIPLLFESADPADFDLVVLVDAPLEVRRRRLLELRGLEPVEADLMLRAQQPSGPKRSRSQIIIDNAGSLEDLRLAAHGVWRRLRAEAAAGGADPGLAAVVLLAPAWEPGLPCGTLARYADAGIETRMLLATGSGDRSRLWAAALGLRGLQLLDRPPGELDADDAVAAARVRAWLPRSARSVLLLPPRSHPETPVLLEWARIAAEGRPVTVLTRRLRNPHRAAVRLDVRPWRDLCAAAAESAPGAAPAPAAPPDTDWYDDPAGAGGLRFQLLQRA